MADYLPEGKEDSRGAPYYKRDFWKSENLKFAEVHFRMAKMARLVRRIAGGGECELLDLGCGPGTLGRLLPGNIHYHGIDIAIQVPASNMIEMDILQSPVSFRGMRFDLIVAQGLLEYCGDQQSQKLGETRDLLKDNGKFLVTYTNFAHHKKRPYHAHNNVQQMAEFRRDLERHFVVERTFTASYNWNHSMPKRPLMKAVQSHLNVDIPVLNSILGIDRFYICSARPAAR